MPRQNEYRSCTQTCTLFNPQVDINVLKEVFPEVPEDTIRQLRIEQNLSMNQVIDILVSQQEKAKPPSLPALLIRHAQDLSLIHI